MALRPDKEVKKEFKKEASKNPDKYYATTILESEGFMRKQCSCGTYFWTTHKDRTICGDPNCAGGFDIAGNSPAKHRLSFVGVWKKITEMLKPRGYTPIARYPVVARWNPTMEYTNASIAAFQPYVISGEVTPPAKVLLIPQFCLRFGDIDNVGITGSHCTGFVMIGQHMFVEEKDWSQEKAFKDIYEFITIGVGLSKDELTMHEDAWAGGGNFGPCMEFFSRGVELFNQVYMMFEQTPDGDKPLKLKVLDMGLGMERVAWFSQGTPNMYEAIFPQVLTKLREIAKIDMDLELYKKFSKYSAFLNVDEVEDINVQWEKIAKEIGVEVDVLKQKVLPMAAIYSIAEHSRALLFALNDGALPSNVGGGYNLRVILRRALSFIDKFKWHINLADVAEWHAEELKEVFPELSENLADVRKVLDVEKIKYNATKEKAHSITQKIIQTEVTEEVLLELYDSNGISPEMIREEALKLGKKIVVPDDFYVKVSQLHEKREQVHQTKKDFDQALDGLPDTNALYFEDYKKTEFTSTILRVSGPKIILKETLFYPTSGGQLHDLGTINSHEVTDVYKQGGVIVHIAPTHDLKEGDEVVGVINFDRRKQLSVHHTATHIINAAARNVLGNHINQAGAKKTLEKASLDITHYESLTEDELKKIEDEANKIVNHHLPVHKEFLPRETAEKKYGMTIYQGGAVPGKSIRIIEVKGVDVEACAGTHLDNTKEVGHIKIIKSTKIQDGVVRLEYVAGDAKEKTHKEQGNILLEAAKILNTKDVKLVPGRTEELFNKWKKAKKGKLTIEETVLTSDKSFDGDALIETAKILRTQPENITKTLSRFKKEMEESIKK